MHWSRWGRWLPLAAGLALLAVPGASRAADTVLFEPEPRSLQGPVIEVDDDELFVLHQGSVVQLEVERLTRFRGALVGLEDLRPGDEIRAVFEVQGTENIARQVERLPISAPGP